MAKKGKIGELDKVYQYTKNKLPQTGFFSTMDELIGSAPFEKAPMQEWKNYLKPGRIFEREGVRFPLKQEELDYTFGHPHLQDVQGSYYIPPGSLVTKEVLRKQLQRLRPDFRLKIGIPSEAEQLGYMEKRFPEESQAYAKTGRSQPQLIRNRYGDYAHEASPENYEESILRSSDFGPTPSHHFGPDSISHSRTTIQNTEDEKALRLIEEIQSDRHQAAAEKLYRDPLDNAIIDEEEATAPGTRKYGEPEYLGRRGYSTPEDESRISKLQDEVMRLEGFTDTQGEEAYLKANRELSRFRNKIPDAPFKDPADYGLFELKNQMLNAAKADQDYLGLVRGSDVSQRFSQGREDAKGTSYVYDKIYRQQLEKLARQYGAEVRDAQTSILSSTDVATPTMRELNHETIHDLMMDTYGHLEMMPQGETVRDNMSTVENVLQELRDSRMSTPSFQRLQATASSKADTLMEQVKSLSPENPDGTTNPNFTFAWSKLKDTLEDLHSLHRQEVTGHRKGSSKSFPSMVLTPEVRERIKKAGVPIWALTGASLAGLGANEIPSMTDDEEVGYAEGGEVDGLDRLRQIAENVGTEKTVDRRKRILAGLASQWYGMNDKSGEPEFLGGDFVGYLPGVAAWRKAHGEPEYYSHGPGILDEIKSMGLGTRGGVEADDRLEKLKRAIKNRIEINDPRGFQENFDDALGTMMGQLPIPAKSAASVAQKLGLKKRLLRLAKQFPDAAVEWFSPTINPSVGNYLTGAGFGASVGALTDYLGGKSFDERQTERFQENWEANHGMPADWNMKFAEGGEVGTAKGTAGLQSMLSELRSRLQELSTEMPQMSPMPDNSGIPEDGLMKKIGGFAKGGKVKTLLELREMMARNLGSPNVEGTGREMVPVQPDSPLGPTADVPPPESIRGMVDNPPIPSAPFQMSRRNFLHGASSMLMPGDIPLNPEAMLAKQVTKQLSQAMDPGKHRLFGTEEARQDLMDMLYSREEEDYGDAIQGLDEVFQKYPREESLGVRSAMMAVNNYLNKHGDAIWDDENLNNELLELGRVRDKKLEDLGRKLGFKPNPHAMDTKGSEWPENEDLQFDPFIPEHEKLVPVEELPRSVENPHLSKAIDILNTGDPDNALTYLDGVYENGKINTKEYESLLEELEEMIHAEDFGDAE